MARAGHRLQHRTSHRRRTHRPRPPRSRALAKGTAPPPRQPHHLLHDRSRRSGPARRAGDRPLPHRRHRRFFPRLPRVQRALLPPNHRRRSPLRQPRAFSRNRFQQPAQPRRRHPWHRRPRLFPDRRQILLGHRPADRPMLAGPQRVRPRHCSWCRGIRTPRSRRPAGRRTPPRRSPTLRRCCCLASRPLRRLAAVHPRRARRLQLHLAEKCRHRRRPLPR